MSPLKSKDNFKTVDLVFFSGTGGTRRIARGFELVFTDHHIPIKIQELRQSYKAPLQVENPQSDLLILMYPVYAFNAPKPIDQWIDQLPKVDQKPAVVVSVSGGGEIMPNTACRTHTIKQLEKKGYTVIYEDMFVMPSNIFISYHKDLSARLLQAMPIKIHKIVEELLKGHQRRTKPLLLDHFNSASGIIEKKYFGRAFGKRLHATSACTGCGLCTKTCPLGNISMIDKTPTFKENCVICLGCLYSCPHGAIEPGLGKSAVLKEGYNLDAIENYMAQRPDLRPPSELAKGYFMSGVLKYLKEATNFAEYVQVQGVDHFLYHSTTNHSNPVVLFLHGGPGSTMSLFTGSFQKSWEDYFTVVHWDQRGSGKTLLKNPQAIPDFDTLLEDTLGIVQYLKEKYKKEKIIILGHSWGSVLGTIFVKKYPEHIQYYLGVGQVISMFENERMGYQRLREAIVRARDKKSLRKLDQLGEYPGPNFSLNEASIQRTNVVRLLQVKYKLADAPTPKVLLSALRSPIFKLNDFSALAKAQKSNHKLLEFLGDFNIHTLKPKDQYPVPMYFIMGEEDWQTPFPLTQEYFSAVIAPSKKLYPIPKAGHMTMMDQPELFLETMRDILAQSTNNN